MPRTAAGLFDLAGRTALVTGSSQGIGRLEIARDASVSSKVLLTFESREGVSA